MHLNTLKPVAGSKKKPIRVGRGIGSGYGKTCGRGHKGAKARSGYKHKRGFEGGQTPLRRRLPKFGFKSASKINNAEVRLCDLNKLKIENIDLDTLKKAGLIGSRSSNVKVILSGNIDRAINLIGIKATAGAFKAIEAAGGKITEQAS